MPLLFFCIVFTLSLLQPYICLFICAFCRTLDRCCAGAVMSWGNKRSPVFLMFFPRVILTQRKGDRDRLIAFNSYCFTSTTRLIFAFSFSLFCLCFYRRPLRSSGSSHQLLNFKHHVRHDTDTVYRRVQRRTAAGFSSGNIRRRLPASH